MWELTEYSKVLNKFYYSKKKFSTIKEIEQEIMTKFLYYNINNIKEIPNYPINDIDQIKIINTFDFSKNKLKNNTDLLQVCQYIIDTTEINYEKKFAKSDCKNIDLFYQWNEI